jgi:hypothetical protein
MEFKVIRVKETIINEEKLSGTPKYVSFLEGKGVELLIRESDTSSFMPGDRWELKKVISQTKITEIPIKSVV